MRPTVNSHLIHTKCRSTCVQSYFHEIALTCCDRKRVAGVKKYWCRFLPVDDLRYSIVYEIPTRCAGTRNPSCPTSNGGCWLAPPARIESKASTSDDLWENLKALRTLLTGAKNKYCVAGGFKMDVRKIALSPVVGIIIIDRPHRICAVH